MINQNLLLGDDGYNIQRSLRFRSSASAYLNRTPASAGNRKTWTWSGWVKRGSSTGQPQFIFGGGQNGVFTDSSQIFMQFNTSDQILISTGATNLRLTSQVFRDYSSWYHIVLNVDTTQATAANRLKLYVNGSEVTAFATNNNVAQNTDLGVNQTLTHNIGTAFNQANTYFDGYLTEVNFIDGQALTPSSFGETDLTTGVWKPKKYTGTYGTNGFYLNFSDNSAATAAAIGKDYSGNGNNWTPNNISVTAGATYDSMTDVPTLTSATASNFCVLNPLDNNLSSSKTLSIGNLRVVTGTTTSSGNTFGTLALPQSGKFYWEGVGSNISSAKSRIGIYTNDGVDTRVIYLENGTIITDSTSPATVATYTDNDVIGVACNIDAGTITFYKNNVSQGAISYSFTGKTLYPYIAKGDVAALTFDFNFGQRPFSYTPPTGFKALNTFNLPDSTIKKGNKYFDTTTFTGNGTSQSVVNSGGFQPDFVWLKNRSIVASHVLSDAVRGATANLFSDQTAAESVDATRIASLNSNGFSVGTAPSTNGNTNALVAWQWNAGGSTVTNTSGSISSQVRANPTAGFSVVTYTGTGANATVGHGLGVAPSMIIVKKRSLSGGDWKVYHKSLGASGALNLDLTNAFAVDSAVWQNTSPTSSVFSIGTNTDVNQNTQTFVSYCFSEVAGFSKFGSYTGNGSTDGAFVYCGFRPKFVLIKRTDTTAGWVMYDTSRDTYNQMAAEIYPHLSNAEDTAGSVKLDFISNGFKLRGTGAYGNGSGGTFIYMAFAENPFKNSLAR